MQDASAGTVLTAGTCEKAQRVPPSKGVYLTNTKIAAPLLFINPSNREKGRRTRDFSLPRPGPLQ